MIAACGRVKKPICATGCCTNGVPGGHAFPFCRQQHPANTLTRSVCTVRICTTIAAAAAAAAGGGPAANPEEIELGDDDDDDDAGGAADEAEVAEKAVPAAVFGSLAGAAAATADAGGEPQPGALERFKRRRVE